MYKNYYFYHYFPKIRKKKHFKAKKSTKKHKKWLVKKKKQKKNHKKSHVLLKSTAYESELKIFFTGRKGGVPGQCPGYPGQDVGRQIQGQTNISSLPRLIKMFNLDMICGTPNESFMRFSQAPRERRVAAVRDSGSAV